MNSGRVYFNPSCPQCFFLVTSHQGLCPGYPETRHLGNGINNRCRRFLTSSQPFSHVGPERILRLPSAQVIRACAFCVTAEEWKPRHPRRTLTHRPGPVHYYGTTLLCPLHMPVRKLRSDRARGMAQPSKHGTHLIPRPM